MKKYENILFVHDHDEVGEKAFRLLSEVGQDECIEFLAQWHYPGESEIRDCPSAGSRDTVVKSEQYEDGRYLLSYNSGLGYIGLEWEYEEN